MKELVGDITVAVGTLTPKGPRMYSHRNFGHVFYRSLRLTAPQRIQRELAGKSPGVGFNWLPFTPGEWDGLEADVMVLAINSMHEKATLLKEMASNPLWNSHPAVKTDVCISSTGTHGWYMLHIPLTSSSMKRSLC